MAQTQNPGVPSIREALRGRGISEAAAETLKNATRRSTRKLYQMCIKLWSIFCLSRDYDPVHTTAVNIVNSLQTLLDSGNRGYSAICTARSALSSIVTLDTGSTVGNHPLVKQFIMGVFNLRPPQPRYTEIWDLEVVLNFLRSWEPSILFRNFKIG